MSSTPSKPRYFGTDGLRDVANRGMLTPENLLRLGRALGRFANERGGGILMARDPRRSSALLVASVSAGAAAEGANVTDLGVLPTPGLAALVPQRASGIGVMISASHNPMADNGVKVISKDGAKLSDSDEAWLEASMNQAPSAEGPIGAHVGNIVEDRGAGEAYLAHLVAGFPGLDLKGRTIVVDCANGATSEVAPRLFARLGAKVIALSANPDGLNINEGCGAVHPERLALEVKERGADLGVGFDGDGDRMIAVSSDGVVRDGDAILYVCARRLAAEGRLKDNAVVGTVMTNFGLELALHDLGGRLIRTPVGDRHIAAQMREHGYDLGGEPSGHLIFGARNRFIGDGMWSALALLETLRALDAPFHELLRGLAAVPQELMNLKVKVKPPLESLSALKNGIADAERKLGATGRVLVRYSGTENLLRVMVEGRDAKLVSELAATLVETARAEIG